MAEERLRLSLSGCDQNKQLLTEQAEEIRLLRQECRRRKKMLSAQQLMMGQAKASHYQCNFCDKAFMSQAFLQSHIHRRHPTGVLSWEKYEGTEGQVPRGGGHVEGAAAVPRGSARGHPAHPHGATSSAPLVSQRLLSASNSHELLLNLNNGQLLPLQFQSAFNSWIPSFPGFLQQQQQQQQQQPAQVPGRPQFPLSTLESFAGLFPNQLPFSGQMSYVVPFKVSQDQTQDVQGEQQHLAFDSFVGTAPESPGMPTEGGPLHSQREPVNLEHDTAVFMPSTSPKLSTDHVFTSVLDPTIAPGLQKVPQDQKGEKQS
ncbi:hypothetical protein STEG23_009899, partial [Scotinomys teguina]